MFGRNDEDTRSITSDQLGGEIILINPLNLRKIIKRIDVRTPMGLFYDKKRNVLLAGSDHYISLISGGKVVGIVNNNLFNCIHWLAAENGYNKDPFDKVRVVNRGVIHQGAEYCTSQHTTHVNSVVEFKPNQLLATLFHQGLLVELIYCMD